VEHLAFKVKSLKDTLAKLDAAGTRPAAGATPTQAFVLAPNGVKVQLVEDTALATPVASYEMLMKVSSAADAAAWYEKWFGARITRQGQSTVAEIPGMNIRFAETKEPVAGTQGRAINHIGLEVKNRASTVTWTTPTTPYSRCGQPNRTAATTAATTVHARPPGRSSRSRVSR